MWGEFMEHEQSEDIKKEMIQTEKYMLRHNETKTYFQNYDLLSYKPIFKDIEKVLNSMINQIVKK